MPVVTLVPKTDRIELELERKVDELRTEMKEAICRISGFPESDVLIHLAWCPYCNADPAAADVTVQAETCPHEELEKRADELRDEIQAILIKHGFDVDNAAETWFRFVPGSWVQTKNGEVVDSVSHQRGNLS